MAKSPEPLSSSDLDAVVEEYLRRVDAGENIDQEKFLAEHAEVAPALRSFFANEQLVRQWTAGAPPAAGDTAPKDGLPTIPPSSVNPAALAGVAGAISLPAMMGRYRIDRELGRGAMGAVYLAHDTELDRPVALKIPKFSGQENPDLIARFLREARSAAVLAHPNICRVYDVSEFQGTRYIAMEYIEGKPLSAFVAGGNVQPKQAATVVRKLAQGLADAHRHGIIHRDLKPDNILVNRNGEPVLTDFGLARETAKGSSTATQDGVILGSPAYMPPEQAAGNLSDMGPTSDIYSLGVVLYELLTGEVPFRGSVVEVLASVLMKPPPTVRERNPNVDPGLAAICDRMMSKKAKDRPQSMTEVAQLLNDWLKSPQSATIAPPKPATDDGMRVAEAKPKSPSGQSLAPKQTLSPGSTKVPGAKQTMAPAVKKAEPERTPQQLKELGDLVDQLLARNDYLEAIPILEAIPDYQRTPQLRQLLGEAYELKATVEKLERSLEKHLNLIDLPELKKCVDKLLKIHPSHPRAKEIRKALNTEGKRGVVRILKDEGNYHGGGFAWEWWQVGAALAAIGLIFVGVSYAVFLYIKGNTEVVQIEIDDPTAIVKIDGKTATISGAGTGEVRLKLGEHNFVVERGDTTVVTTGTYEVTKAGRNVLRITLKDLKPGETVADAKPTPKPKDGEFPAVFDGHTAGVLSVCVSPDSRFAYSGSDDQSVRAWEIATGKQLWKFETGGATYGLAVSPDGTRVGIGSSGGTWIVNAATGEKIRQFAGPNAQTQGVTFTAEGRQVVTSGLDGNVRRWDVESGNETLLCDRTGNTHTAVVITPDRAEIFAASGGGTIETWDLETGKPREVFQDAAIHGMDFSRDGALLAAAGDDKSVGLWDWKSRKLLYRMAGHADRVMEVGFLPDGRHLVSGGLDKKMILWNLETKQPVKEWPAHEDSLGVRSLAVAPNGRFIVSGGYDSKVRLWKSPVASSSDPAPEFTWELARSRQAKLANIKNPAQTLDAAAFNGMFTEIPARLTAAPTKIFIGEDNIASFDVVEDGFVILTCNYDYQGNDSGGWLEKRWTADQFAASGWKQLSEAEVGGRLYAAPYKRMQTFFVKFVRKGETYSLSCNKSDPPYLIQFETSGGPVIGDAPPLAVAPFDANQAKAHQEAWAKYLGVPVEFTNSVGMKFRLIPPGEFTMGSPDSDPDGRANEKPQHKVRITKPFYLGMTELTQTQWQAVMGTTPWEGQKNVLQDPNAPASYMSYVESEEFCRKLTAKDSPPQPYRIPTEAEWEYAARGGTEFYFGFSNDIDQIYDYVWTDRQNIGTPHAVATRKPNPFGLHDMLGNVWEWCSDYYSADYSGRGEETDPTGPRAGTQRINRGGGWTSRGSSYRSAVREPAEPEHRGDAITLRPVLPIEAVKAAAAAAPPPAPAAPFDANQAKAHQEAWAKHLGVPVEFTNELGMKFRLIPPGEFTRGSTPEQIKEWAAFYPADNQDAQDRVRGEGPQHKVILTKPFYLGMHEVTQKQYEQVMGVNPSGFHPKSPNERTRTAPETDTSNYPVDSVGWADATEFCAKLNASKNPGAACRLPTEAEWEYACRAGTAARYWTGDDSQEIAAAENFGGSPRPVGELRPNPFGLHDMNGNLREWASDWWSIDEFQKYATQPAVDPLGAKDGNWRVLRGGSWGVDPALQGQASLRLYDRPGAGNAGYGFRVALSIDSAKLADSAPPAATADGEGAVVLSGHTRAVIGVAAHPDGRHVLSASDDGTVRGWDVAAGQEMLKVASKSDKGFFCVAVSPDGKLFAAGSQAGEINVYEFPSGNLLHSFDGNEKQIQGVAFTTDSHSLFSGSIDTSLLWWDVRTGKPLRSFQGNGSGVTAVIATPDGKEVLTGGGDGVIRAGTLKTARLRVEWPGHTGPVLGLAVSPDGKLVASAGSDKTVRVRKLNGKKNDKELHVLDGHTDRVSGVAFLPDGRHLVSAGFDRKLILWDVERGQVVKEWPAHASAELGVRGIAVAPTGEFLVTGGYDAKVRIWKPEGPGAATAQALPLKPGPVLISPAPGAELANGSARQNKDYVWDFDWEDVPQAAKYHLQVSRIGAAKPLIDEDALTASQFSAKSTNSHVIAKNRRGWAWKVRAYVDGAWTDWSEARPFDVAEPQ